MPSYPPGKSGLSHLLLRRVKVFSDGDTIQSRLVDTSSRREAEVWRESLRAREARDRLRRIWEGPKVAIVYSDLRRQEDGTE